MEESREMEDIRTAIRLTDGALNFVSQRLALAEQFNVQLKDGLDAQQQVTRQLLDDLKRQSILINMALMRIKAMEGSDNDQNGGGSCAEGRRKSLKLRM